MNNILEYLENSAIKYADKPAFVDENMSLTFRQLLENSKRVGSYLLTITSIKKPVVIMMEKSASCIAAFMGVVYSGCFYVPVDTKMPADRLNLIFESLNPSCIICDSKNIEKMKSATCQYLLIDYEEMLKTTINDSSLLKIRQQVIDTDLLYVLFTSGSTGIPKGVTICHKSVIDFTDWMCTALNINDTFKFGNQASFHFDLSVSDIYCTLKEGSTTYIIPHKCFVFPKSMIEFLDDKHINTICWVPSALVTMANSGVLQRMPPRYVNAVYFCGEVMPCKQLNIWKNALPDAVYCNMYGPTEITEACTYFIVDRELSDEDVLPIGKPCENTRIIILDENDNEVQGDSVGELCVAGSSLALGYYNNHEKTKQVFVQNPLNKAYTEIIYRTGDLAKYNEKSELIYVGRKDFQIKHKGYRIELGEIETAIGGIKNIDNVCCLYDENKMQIVCFYVGNTEINDIKNHLKFKLQEYMVPESFIRLDKLPQTVNGKTDRLTLKTLFNK